MNRGWRFFPYTLFPEKMRVILPYRSQETSISGAVRHDLYWRGNGPLDCCATSAAHNAYGFDTLAKYYGYYRCLASSIRVYVWAESDSQVPIQYKLGPHQSEDHEAYGRYNRNKVVMKASNTRSERGKCVVLKNACSTRRMYPYSLQPNPNVWALINAQPSLSWYWYLSIWNIVGTSEFNEVTIRGLVALNYYCEFAMRDIVIQEDAETHGVDESPATPP